MPDQPSSRAVLERLWRVKGNDLGGMTASLTFTENQNAPRIACSWPPVKRSATSVIALYGFNRTSK